MRLRITLSENQTHLGRKVEKPWGYELIWAETDKYVAKLLFVKAGESLSLQYHRIKEETMYLESGDILLEAGDSEESLAPVEFKAGSVFHIPPGTLHRLTARTDCRIFEASTPHLDDVVRLQDKYGRS